MIQTIYPKTRNIQAAIYEAAHSHFHDGMSGFATISFGYIVCGKVEITAEDRLFFLKPGDLFAISPGCRYQSRWMGDPDIVYYGLHLLPEPDAPFYTFPIQKIEHLSTPETGRQIYEIIQSFKTDDYTDRMRSLSMFYGFYANALQCISNITQRQLNPALVTAVRYINQNYCQECSINELCDISFVSPSHLYYLFHSELNTTPIHYRNRIRVEKCAEMLRQTDRDENDIAESCGFHSLAYFRECFTKKFGMTPYRYRNLSKQK